MTNLLTVILILKDRSKYTKFQMKYLNEFQFPYPLIIADGGKDEEIKSLLRNKKNFPNIEYEYIEYPYDDTPSHFYKKIKDASCRVTTPFTILTDNDDFYLASGLAHQLEFLVKNPDYSSSRGILRETWYNPESIKQNVKLGNNLYGKYLENVTGNSAGLRMLNQSNTFHGNWHNVIRTSHLQATLSLLEIANPVNLRFAEQIIGFLNTLWGNSRRGQEDFMLCSQNSERVVGMQDKGQASPTNHFCKILNWLHHYYWVEDFASMTDVIAGAMAHWDKVNLEEASEAFRVIYSHKANVANYIDILVEKYENCKKIHDKKRIGRIFEFLECHDFYKSHRILEGQSFNFGALDSQYAAKDVVEWIEKGKAL